MFRGFRYQTGEIIDLAATLGEKGHADADIDNKEDLALYDQLLAGRGCVRTDQDPVYRVVDHPEFFVRLFYRFGDQTVYVDYYLIEENVKDGYDEIFWG